MQSIRIAEPPHPAKQYSGDGAGSTYGDAATVGGVYPMRRLSKVLSQKSFKSVEQAEDEDAGLRQASDFKKRQIFSGKLLFWLAYQSIGVIYGDIGTSPLYVFSSTFTSEPSYKDLVGVLSIVIWSLTLMVTVKYVVVILHADNEGEGGTFSTYSLLSRYANIANRDPREASLIRMQRYRSGELGAAGEAVRSVFEKSRFARGLLKTIGVLAVTMVMSDGVLTPAQSVLGAVQGLEVVVPNINKATIVGTTCGILILLFLIQPLGVSKIASAFAPIIIIWLAFNAVFGIYNLAKFDHSVLKAFNPAYAFEYLIRTKTDGWKSLGGVLLAFTGVEALFADLGAFSMRAIQLSWLCYCFPCLLLAYIGQAAYISKHPAAYANPFFNAAPPGTLIPSLIIAILAAIVASQAIITATFQLLAQIMKLSYFPQIKVVHTSKVFHGQIFVPLLNWALMVGTVLIAAIYNNTTSLGNAYGVCVMFVTFFDSLMVALAAIFVWKFSPYLVFLPWLTIACLDGTFLSSALIKVPDGAWFTLTLAGVLACLLIEWRFGKENQWRAEAEDRFPTTHFVKKTADGRLRLTERYGGVAVSSINGFGIFFDKAGETTPIVFSQFLSKLRAAPEVMVFFHLRPLETPTIPPEERYSVSRLAIPHCYRLVVRHGYTDNVVTADLASLVYQQVRDFIIRRGTNTSTVGAVLTDDHAGMTDEPMSVTTGTAITFAGTAADGTRSGPASPKSKSFPSASETPIASAWDVADEDQHKQTVEQVMEADLSKLDEAFDHQVLYIIGKEQMRVRQGTGFFRAVLLNAFLWIRDNTRTKIANLRVPTERVIEVGFVKDV